MISNTQANSLMPLLNAGSNPALPLITGSQAQAPSAIRFDLTLLQMTSKIHAEGASFEEGAVTPPVKAAFESVLNDFSQLPKEQLPLLQGDAELKGQVVAKAAEQFALEPKETRVLKALVELASRRLAEPVALEIASPQGNDINARTPSVLHSGPKGGTTESSPQGNQILKPLAGLNPAEPEAAPLAPRPRRILETEGTLPELAALGALPVQPLASQAPQVPVLISTRTQGAGSGEGNEVTPLASTNLRSEVPMRREAPVLQLTSSVPTKDGQPQAAPVKVVNPQQEANQAPRPVASQPAPAFEAVITKAQNQVQGRTTPETPKDSGKPALPVTNNIEMQVDQESPVEPMKRAAMAPEAPARPATPLARPSFETGTRQQLPPMPQGMVAALPQAPGFEMQSQGLDPMPLVQADTEIQVAAAPRRETGGLESPESGVKIPQPEFAARTQPAAAPQLQAAAPLPLRESAVLQPARDAKLPAAESGEAGEIPSSPSPEKAPAPQGMRFSGMRRWLAETVTRFNDAQPVQAQAFQADAVIKSVANNVTREFQLRETVFNQAMEAISNASEDASRLRIKLKPESLGELDVVLSVEAGKVTARLVTSTIEVRDVFAGNLQQFKAELEARGLTVSQLSVAVRAETQSQGQPQQQPQQPQAWAPQGSPKPQSETPLLAAAWSALAGKNMNANLTRFSALA